jgi:hypothetical protein
VHCEQFYSLQYGKWTITHCTWEQAYKFQNELPAATNWKLHIMEAYRQEERFAYRYILLKIASL